MKKRLCAMLSEKTLVLVKPDAVKRGLIGAIIQRLEQTGLKIVACKMISATRQQLAGHFPKSEEWVRGMGDKTVETFAEHQLDLIEILGTNDPDAIGQKIKEWNYRYLMGGPMMALVLEGVHAIDTVRKIIGDTAPYKAAPGTIRGDFSIDSPVLANVMKRSSKNLVHASGNPAEAKQEIANWFNPNELVTYGKNQKKGGE